MKFTERLESTPYSFTAGRYHVNMIGYKTPIDKLS
jgi:hypothetical protein